VHLHEVARDCRLSTVTLMTYFRSVRFPIIDPLEAGLSLTALEFPASYERTTVGGKALLYFAYNARIAPEQMAEAAPSAEFRFIAHLPEWGLEFPIRDSHWRGALPAITPEPGSTVWGAVYEIGRADLAQLDAIELRESRSAKTVEAMDRTGKRHQVLVHLLDDGVSNNGNGSESPSSEYLSLMVAGSRHWNLPFGWIAGLEEHLENGK
jgi:hypothetical protein